VAYWLFTVSMRKYHDAGVELDPMNTYSTRMDDSVWGFHLEENRKQPPRHLDELKAGDRVVFYIASPYSALAGVAELDSGSMHWNDPRRRPEEWARWSHEDNPDFLPPYVVMLRNIVRWESLRPKDLLPQGFMLQGSIHSLEQELYEQICGRCPQA